ncbi:MAG TPA: two-component regulator propeller domain-containing protein [Verrucomicrobiae bacterium]|jgi:signal transduction histidine kinase
MFQDRSAFRATAGGLALFLLMAAACAEVPPSDPLIDVWDTADGLPNSTVTSITQTPDGYLWVGTYNGLARFDGTSFVTFDPLTTPALRHARIQGLAVDANGTLWINTYRGSLTSYRDGVFRAEWTDESGFDLHTTLAYSSSNEDDFVTQFGSVLRRTADGEKTVWTSKDPPQGARPIFQCAGADGVLWFLSRDGRIIRFTRDVFMELPGNGGLPAHVATVSADASGRIWAGAVNFIGFWNGAKFVDRTPANAEEPFEPNLLLPTENGAVWALAGDRLRKQDGRRWVAEASGWRGLMRRGGGRGMGAHEDRQGGVWFNHYGNGVFHITSDGRFLRLTMKNGLPGDRVGAWFEGRDGGIWLGTDRGGLARLRDRRFQVVGLPAGPYARSALSVCETRDGAIWIGTGGGGLCRWSGGMLASFAVGQSTADDFVFSLCPRPDGGLWLSAGEENLLEFKDGAARPASWEAHGVKAILTDHAGRVWIGGKTGLSWWQAGARRAFGPADGLPLSAVRALAEDSSGTVWCGSDDGALYRCETNHLQAFRPDDGLAGQPILSLLADRGGVVWAGTFRGGLLRFENGQFQRISAKQGFYADVIGQIVQDHQGRLWLGTHRGLFCATKASLNACAEGKAKSVDYVTYGRLDGLPTLEFADGYQPACWAGHDGRLWFATVKGVVSIQPDELSAQAGPARVVIEEVDADGEPLALRGGSLIIPPGHKQFGFRFTALTFDAPDKTRFRYQLEGFDTDWVDADTRRTAHYGNLAPNHYRFHVAACNSAGVWNEKGAALELTVQPHFYQTWWFLAAAGAGILGGGAGLVRLAVARKYRRELARMEQQHAIERDRARIAQDIHDDLGAGLTQITLLSELARREPADTGEQLERISRAARQLTRAMDEIVWAVDPQHDTLNGLIDYVSAYAEDFLRVAGIRCRMDVPADLPVRRIEAETRYHLFLAVKEALNNVVKHAQATEVWLRLRVEGTGCTLIVEDNGRGCRGNGNGNGPAANGQDRLANGSGLPNLKKRLHSVGGRCTMRSAPGQGMRVEMAIQLKEFASPIVAIGQNGAGH